MKNLLDKTYDLFASRLNKWFILAGIASLGLNALFTFIGGVSSLGSEAFYYIVLLAFQALIIVGLIVGHYRNKEPLLFFAFIAFLVLLAQGSVVGATFGASALGQADTTYVLRWVFSLIYAIVLGCFLVCILLVYLFKVKLVVLVLKASFFLSLIFGVVAWIFGIVYAANGYGWTNAIIPLLEVGSLLMIPGLLEELLPGELDGGREEKESEE